MKKSINLDQMNDIFKQYYLNIIFFISFLASIGTLYYSEVEELLPCDLCWYQRALMYPIAIISLIAIITKDKKVEKYFLGLAIPGLIIAAYNYLLQKTEIFTELGTCSPSNPCSGISVEYFGFITIPFMSFTAFTFMAIISLYSIWLHNRGKS